MKLVTRVAIAGELKCGFGEPEYMELIILLLWVFCRILLCYNGTRQHKRSKSIIQFILISMTSSSEKINKKISSNEVSKLTGEFDILPWVILPWANTGLRRPLTCFGKCSHCIRVHFFTHRERFQSELLLTWNIFNDIAQLISQLSSMILKGGVTGIVSQVIVKYWYWGFYLQFLHR